MGGAATAGRLGQVGAKAAGAIAEGEVARRGQQQGVGAVFGLVGAEG